MNIIITGVTGFRNRGVEALVRPTVNQLTSRYPDANIQIVTWSPAYDSARLPDSRVSYVQDSYLQSGSWRKPAGSTGPTLMQLVAKRASQKFLKPAAPKKAEPGKPDLDMPFDKADLVIVSGGDLFSSDYGTASLNHFCSPVHWALQNDVPIALIGQSVGRFKCDEDAAIWNEAEKNASLITLREASSRNYLTEKLGSPADRLPVTADTAFLLDPDTTIADQHMPASEGPWVALSISESICGWTGNNYEAHREAWVQLIKLMLDRWNVRVAIIPHVQEPGADDRVVSSWIARELGFDRRVRVFAEDLSAAEFKGLVSRSEMVVAERMHAAIAGLSTGRCTVPVGYSIKAEGITAAVMEGSSLNSSDLVIPVSDLFNVPSAFAKLDNAWQNREAYAAAAAKGSVKQKALALKNFEMIDALLAKAA
ncbi:polysaccharide pyruvyl transferase family protein [Prosthecobacter sp.]|uniref:polysaccharide pyruvyl transferase family protein n=1 Tax=Prosthecobacter sp. TaxID=1965333 RepID=UPI003784F27F